MKKVGLLTMHRVLNFGSVLQAYATQYVIEKLGYDCFIIDYQYPNRIHHQEEISFVRKVERFILQILQGNPAKKKRIGFHKFRENYFRLTRYYPTRDALIEKCPDFDVYMVGSDQTWNIRHIGHDDTFLLNFVPKQKRKISFSSSAARKFLPGEFYEKFKLNLNEFDNISVREKNSQELIKNLLGRDVPVTLDPTLLLTKEEWGKIAETATIKDRIKGPFILAYILKYSFYPYPIATDVIRAVHDKYNIPIVCIRYSAKENIGIDGVVQLNEGISPEDFLWLFKNASFCISTSFHGTAFSLVFERPFYSIVNTTIEDDRIISLLNVIGAEDRAILNTSDKVEVAELDYSEINKNIQKERDESINYLKNALS